MLIALPRKITGMRTLEQEISPTVVNKWLKNMTNRSAEISQHVDQYLRKHTAVQRSVACVKMLETFLETVEAMP